VPGVLPIASFDQMTPELQQWRAASAAATPA
jgi:hypothetical protein